MTELAHAELAEELDMLPGGAKGWSWTWQRCGRYEYRKCLTRSTNLDHLVPSAPSPTDAPALRISNRYLAGRPSARRPAP